MAFPKVLFRSAVIGVGLVAASPIPNASACQLPYCDPDYFLPYEGSVPANVSSIQWRPGSFFQQPAVVRDQADLELVCESAPGVTHDVAFHIEGEGDVRLIVLDEVLVSAETCALGLRPEATQCQWFDSPSAWPSHVHSRAQFVVNEAASEPVSLGAIHAEAARLQTTRVAFFSGCDSKEVVVCGAEIEIELDAEAAPWRDALAFETFVDGEHWDVQASAAFQNPTGGSFVGRRKDVIFARSTTPQDGTAPGTTFGTHTVTMRATLPGTDVMLETAPIEITLDCSNHSNADAGDDIDGGALLDGGIRLDASVLHPIFGPNPSSGDEGCSCSVVGPRVHHSFAWVWSLAAIALLAVRRVRAQG